MFRKTTLALAAVTAFGAAALAPTTADAHWRGYGWYGKHYQPYGYGYSYGWYPRYGYGYGYGFKRFGWKKSYGHY
jgi:hypothetical protein